MTALKNITMICFLLFAAGTIQMHAQVLIPAHNTDYTTNLNGWNGTLPTGFTRYATNGYQGTAVATTGGVYAIPNGGFGYRPSSNSAASSCWIEGSFKNTTGSPITELVISYQAFTISSEARIPTWSVTSSLGNVSALNWTYNASNTINSPASKTVTLTGLNVANNATFTIRFSADRGTGGGSSPMIGLGNIKVKSVAAAVVCDEPIVLPATGLTHEAADLQWNSVTNASSYQYVIDQNLADPAGAGTATTATTHSASGLTPSTTYYIHVRTVCGSSFSDWTTISFGTDYPPCPDPENLTAENITHESADLSWDAITGATGYEYIVDEISAAPATSGTHTTANTYEATGLTPNTQYYLHVRTDCDVNMSEWITIPFTTDYTPCPEPTGLAVTNITHAGAELGWDVLTGITGFEYINDQNSTDPVIPGISITSTLYIPSGLAPNTEYFFHVRTNCGVNMSDWVTISYTTDYTPCTEPTGLAATNITHESAELDWDAITGVAGFEYTVDMVSTSPVIAGTATTANAYDAAGLTANTDYFLHVRTNCDVNMSGWITIPFTTDYTPCPEPTGLTATNITHQSAELDWNAITGVEGFEYTVDLVSTSPVVAGTATTANAYDAAGLTANTDYFLHVRTNCDVNMSGWITIPFTTDYTPCQGPSGLTATNITHQSAELDWNAITGVAGFEYTVDLVSTSPAVAGTATTANSYDAAGLNSNTTYYLHVRTDCDVNFSEWVTLPFVTDHAPCQDPTGLTAGNITSSGATITWNAAPGIANFEFVFMQNAASPTGWGSPISATTHTATNLSPNTVYHLHLRKNCGPNFSNWISISFTTLPLSTAGIEDLDLEDVQVYPNPFQDHFTIATEQGSGKIELISLNGQVLQSMDLDQKALEIDMTNYEKGFYFIRYTRDASVITKQIVKQ